MKDRKHIVIEKSVKERLEKYCKNRRPKTSIGDMATYIIEEYMNNNPVEEPVQE